MCMIVYIRKRLLRYISTNNQRSLWPVLARLPIEGWRHEVYNAYFMLPAVLLSCLAELAECFAAFLRVSKYMLVWFACIVRFPMNRNFMLFSSRMPHSIYRKISLHDLIFYSPTHRLER